MPVYNGRRYLYEVLESIGNQTGVSFEIVIVDDGSTDDTPHVIHEFRENNPDLKVNVIRQENRGEATAVNEGLMASTADFIAVVNSDDPIAMNCLEVLHQMLLDRPNVVVAYPDWVMIDSVGSQIKKQTTLNFDRRVLWEDFICIPGPGALIRRAAIRRGHLRDTNYRYVSDFESWLYLSTSGDFVRVPLPLATWRMHSASLTATAQGPEIANEHIRLANSLSIESPKARRSLNAHAYFIAATHGLKSEKVPVYRYLARSFLLKPIPTFQRGRQHRSLRILLLLAIPKFGRYIYMQWKANNYVAQGEHVK